MTIVQVVSEKKKNVKNEWPSLCFPWAEQFYRHNKKTNSYSLMATTGWGSADDVPKVKYFCGSLIISTEKSWLSDFKVSCPGVNSATKLLDEPAHYCEHQYPWCLHEGEKAQKADRLSKPHTQQNPYTPLKVKRRVKQKQVYQCITVKTVLQ